MITVIFKSEKKAKMYVIKAKNTEGIYEKGEVICTLKTDDICEYMQKHEDFIAEEILLNF